MRTGFEAVGRIRLQAILLLALVLAIGIVGGIAIDRVWRGHEYPGHSGEPPPGLPPELKDGMDLTPEQETRIQAILDRSRPRTDAILDEFFPRLRQVADSIRTEIRAVLTPAQQKLFDSRQSIMKGPGGGHMFEPPHDRSGSGPPAGGSHPGPPPGPR